MSSTRRALLLSGIVIALAAIFPLACGGSGNGDSGNGDSPQGTDVPLTTCKPASPPVFGTPANVPAGNDVYQSTNLGYSVQYPADWRSEPDKASFQNIYGDAFFSPGLLGDVQPNITVTCETIGIGTDTATFADLRRALLQKMLGASPSKGATVQVDGKSAFFWHYKLSAATTPVPEVFEKIEVVFADDRGGWVISLVAPDGKLGDYQPVFDAFLASFHEQ
jgi:hypothetical protein